jgi:hypothetical protein
VPEIRIPLQKAADPVTLQTGQKYRIVIERIQLEVYLHDIYRKPLPGAPFELKCGEESFQGKAGDQGKLVVKIRSLSEQCTVRWSSDPDADPARFEYEREIFLLLQPKDDPEGHKRRLHNLGLPSLDEVDLALGQFQSGWDLEPTHQSDDKTVAKLDKAAREPIAHDDESDGSGGDDSGDRT